MPVELTDAKKLKGLERSFVDHLYTNAVQIIWHNRALELMSEPNEDQDAFLGRCREAARRMSEDEANELALILDRFAALPWGLVRHGLGRAAEGAEQHVAFLAAPLPTLPPGPRP